MRLNIFRLLTVIINYYSAVYVLSGITLAFLFSPSFSCVTIFVFIYVYLVPPVLCRLLISLFGRPVGTVNSDSKVFIYWWFLTQLQIIFVRLPFLEELLRIFPGLYSFWLNIWGGRISLLTYWSPGVILTDRYHLNIERGVIIGGGCRIGAHIITITDNNLQRLTLAPVTIEHNSVIGFNAAIGPGCHVYPGETLPAAKILKPFYAWQHGKIKRPDETI